MEDEIWKTIEQAPNYAISNKGEVINKITKKFLKPWDNGKGYLRVDLHKKKYPVHKLVAIHFLNNPMNFPVIDHIDNNRQNNNVSNLRWTTHTINAHNKKISGDVEYRGVSMCADCPMRPFKAQIQYKQKKYTLGHYKTAEGGAIAYNQKAYELYGEQAKLNILPDSYYFI